MSMIEYEKYIKNNNLSVASINSSDEETRLPQ